jgi:4-carboxymuconolactone decarboxylase
MARLTEVDLTVATDVADVFKRVTESRGWVSNLMRALAHAPEGLQRYAALGHYGRYGTELTELQRELVIVATVRGVVYGWTHHGNLARQIGVSDAQLEALKQGRVPPDFGAPERALCDYVFAFTALRGVSEPVLRGMLEHFTSRQVVDVALLSSYYMAAGALIVGLDVQLESPDMLRTELEWQKKTLADGPRR